MREVHTRARLLRNLAGAAVAVLLVSGAVVFLAVQQIQRECSAFVANRQQLLSDRSQTAFLGLQVSERAAIDAIGQALQGGLDEPASALERLLGEHALVREPFLLVDGAVIWPQVSSSGPTPSASLVRGSADKPLERQLLARVLELQRDGRRDEAIAALERMLARVLEPRTRVEAALLRANLLALDPSRRDEAIERLDELVRTRTVEPRPADELGPWWVAAMFRRAVLLADVGRTQESVTAFIELLEEFANGALQEHRFSHADFYLTGAQARIAELAAADEPSPETAERVEKLVRQVRGHRSRARFRSILESEWLPEIFQSTPTRGGPPRHLYKYEADEPQLIVFSRDSGDPGRVAGFLVDLGVVCDRLLEGARAADGSESAAAWVVDADGHPIGGATVAAEEEIIETAVSEDLRWSMRVDVRDEVREYRSERTLLYGALAALAVLVITAGAVAVVRSVQRELEIAELKSQFVANVSHELKTPLTLIRMFTDLLLLGYSRDPKEIDSHLRVIARETENLDLLIDNVLDISRIEAGEKHYSQALENPAAIVEEVVDGYRPYLERKGFTIRLELEPDSPPILVDRLAFSQALRNLLSNAVKYSEDVKEIEVGVRRVEFGVELEVADRGVGVSSSEAERIFDRFYRSAGHGQASTGGAGVGLAIVHHIVETHGGSVRAAPREGGGSVFTLTWPIPPSGESVHQDQDDSHE